MAWRFCFFACAPRGQKTIGDLILKTLPGAPRGKENLTNSCKRVHRGAKRPPEGTSRRTRLRLFFSFITERIQLFFPRFFSHDALVFSQKTCYNKVVIPQTRYQQNLEKAEMMSNTKKNRNIYFAVITVAVVVFTLGGIGVLSAQESNASASASKKKTVKTANNVKAPKLAKETFSYISTAQEVLKDGRTYKAGEDQPYTGYVWVRREDLPLQADKTKYPGDDVRIFLYHKDGKSQSGNYLRSKYVPKYSAI